MFRRCIWSLYELPALTRQILLVQSTADSYNRCKGFFPLDHRPRTAREKSNQQVNFQALINVGQINQSKTADTETVENYFSRAIAETEEAIEAQKEPL